MGSIVKRGPRDNAHYYVKYKDVDGRWKMRLSKQRTKDEANTYLARVESRVANGLIGIEEPKDTPTAGTLMADWAKSLVNRNADDDRRRYEKHLKPVFHKKRLPEITLGLVMTWVDEQRRRVDPKSKARLLSDGSVRHNMNLLSRFFSWAIARGHATVNPVRQIPTGKRPQQPQKRDAPWLDDDAIVCALIAKLPEPSNLMFYLGNQCGLRTGEIAGLRMSDLGFLDEGVVRARFSYAGPLKEDKNGDGKVKWVPAPTDCAAFLADWLTARKATNAGPEDFVFPCANREGSFYRKEFIEQCWEKTREQLAAQKGDQKLEINLTWYQATRHSFVSRNLSRGASLDEVSSAVGHSSPVVTRRYYDHFVRKTFSETVRKGLGLGEAAGKGAGPRPGT